MLTLKNDPYGVTGGQLFPLDYAISLQENIANHLASGGGCELLINGEKVDPLTDRRLDIPPGPSDHITVIRRPEGWEAVYYIIVIALLVYSYANRPNVPDDSIGKDSPNNKLTAQTNVARAYQAIPDAYGYRRLWPDLIQPGTSEYIDNVKYVTQWLCISRGKGSVTDVRYAESPIEDIAGSSFEIFEPAPSDGYAEFSTTTLNDVVETFASDEVNGQEIAYPDGVSEVLNILGAAVTVEGDGTLVTVTTTDGPEYDGLKAMIPYGAVKIYFEAPPDPLIFDQFCQVISYEVTGGDVKFSFLTNAFTTLISVADVTITTYEAAALGPFTLPIDCTDIWWNVVFLRGLRGSVDVLVEWWRIDSGGTEIGGTREEHTYTYTADTYDQCFFTTKASPLAGEGRYRIQFTRLTPTAADGINVSKLEEVFAVRTYPTKVVPGATVIRVTTKATLSATGFSDLKFNVRWLRHVRGLVSDDVGPSRNFARILAHIWTIAGNDIAGLDVDALLAINSDHGEDSPLLRFDGSIDDADVSLGERMQLVANTARCIVWRDGTRWAVTRDERRSAPDMQLDYRNLARGGESVINYAAHLPASFDGVEVTYVDETSQAKKQYVRLSIATGEPVVGESLNPKRINLTSCATTEQAENRAYLEARKLLYQRTTVNDEALADAMQLPLGALVKWVDPNDFGGDDGLQAGEVLAIAGDVIAVSEPLDWKGETSGRILFTGTDGRHLGPPVVCTPTVGGVRLASVPNGLYVADADRQLGSRYAFAVGLTSAELESAGLYTVTKSQPTAKRTVSLALVEYDERIYEDD